MAWPPNDEAGIPGHSPVMGPLFHWEWWDCFVGGGAQRQVLGEPCWGEGSYVYSMGLESVACARSFLGPDSLSPSPGAWDPVKQFCLLPSVQSRQGRETSSKCGFGVLRMEPRTSHMLGKQFPLGVTVSLYNLQWPRTHCVNHAGPELAILPLPPN